MKKFISIIVGLMALTSLTVGLAVSPAGAADWQQSWCRSDVWWLPVSSGVYYWVDGYSEWYGAYLVRGGPYEPMTTYSTYDSPSHECGWLGAPRSNEYHWGGMMYQNFENGYIDWCCAA